MHMAIVDPIPFGSQPIANTVTVAAAAMTQSIHKGCHQTQKITCDMITITS